MEGVVLPDHVSHGTNTAYNGYKCRCESCATFKKAWNRKYHQSHLSRFASYRREQYRKNPEKFKKHSKARALRCRRIIARYKTMKGCARCGYNKHPRALGFHHLDPAQKEFQIALRMGIKMERIKKEIAKCEVLCANCHMIAEDEKKNGLSNTS